MKPLNPANYARRQAGNAVMTVLCMLAALLGIALLGLILLTLLQKGGVSLSLDIFTQPTRSPGQHGGLRNAIIGSLIQTGLGALIGAPMGMLVGIYLAEVGKGGRIASVVRFVNDILLSAPSVLIGLFVYSIAVAPFHRFSGWAGSLALALLAMPIVARTTEDILKLVPDAYREGAMALGSREAQAIRLVVVPAAFGGVLTGMLLAVARIAGETAPLIFTSFGNTNPSSDLSRAMASLPITIYHDAGSAFAELRDRAWAGALIITIGVLALNIASRLSHRLISAKGS